MCNKKYLIGYYKSRNTYTYKEIIAKNFEAAIKKARCKNIDEIFIEKRTCKCVCGYTSTTYEYDCILICPKCSEKELNGFKVLSEMETIKTEWEK